MPRCERGRDGTRRAFERFLTARGQLVKEPDPNRFAPLLDRYREHLVEVRGLTASTADQHIATIERFPCAGFVRRRATPGSVNPGRGTVRGRRGAADDPAQHVVARLRAFLRFCFEQDGVSERLDVIDTPRVYRGELPPRALAWPLVQRLLRSVDRSSRLGWRDYAIFHLMAHYGMRPSEIVTLTLGSIDWQAKTLRVRQCKIRSDLVLPLAGQTMRMLRRNLYRGRPSSARPGCSSARGRRQTPSRTRL